MDEETIIYLMRFGSVALVAFFAYRGGYARGETRGLARGARALEQVRAEVAALRFASKPESDS